jgi:hypothetical protein
LADVLLLEEEQPAGEEWQPAGEEWQPAGEKEQLAGEEWQPAGEELTPTRSARPTVARSSCRPATSAQAATTSARR